MKFQVGDKVKVLDITHMPKKWRDASNPPTEFEVLKVADDGYVLLNIPENLGGGKQTIAYGAVGGWMKPGDLQKVEDDNIKPGAYVKFVDTSNCSLNHLDDAIHRGELENSFLVIEDNDYGDKDYIKISVDSRLKGASELCCFKRRFIKTAPPKNPKQVSDLFDSLEKLKSGTKIIYNGVKGYVVEKTGSEPLTFKLCLEDGRVLRAYALSFHLDKTEEVSKKSENENSDTQSNSNTNSNTLKKEEKNMNEITFQAAVRTFATQIINLAHGLVLRAIDEPMLKKFPMLKELGVTSSSDISKLKLSQKKKDEIQAYLSGARAILDSQWGKFLVAFVVGKIIQFGREKFKEKFELSAGTDTTITMLETELAIQAQHIGMSKLLDSVIGMVSPELQALMNGVSSLQSEAAKLAVADGEALIKQAEKIKQESPDLAKHSQVVEVLANHEVLAASAAAKAA